MIAPNFAVYQAAHAALDAALVQAGNALTATRYRLAIEQGIAPFGALNLTPDSIRKHPDYRRDNAELQARFERLRALNGANVKRFAKELALERQAARMAKLASNGSAAA